MKAAAEKAIVEEKRKRAPKPKPTKELELTMSKGKKLAIIGIALVIIGGIAWWLYSAGIIGNSVYNFALDWFLKYGDLQGALNGSSAQQINACSESAMAQGINVTDDEVIRAYNDWLAENGYVFTGTVSDRPGVIPSTIADRPGSVPGYSISNRPGIYPG